MAEPSTQRVPHPLTSDVKCLRCGAFNIPDNKICGRCGASLPLVYDEEGNVSSWERQERVQRLLRQGRQPGFRVSPDATRWFLRALVILGALLVAWWILHRR